MITKSQIRQAVDAMREQTGIDFEVKWAYGRPRIYRDGGSREVSPRLSTGPLHTWINAFMGGYYFGQQNGYDRGSRR